MRWRVLVVEWWCGSGDVGDRGGGTSRRSRRRRRLKRSRRRRGYLIAGSGKSRSYRQAICWKRCFEEEIELRKSKRGS
jgi:hypothetical protein